MIIARHDLDPRIRHADEGPRKVFIGETYGLEHGAGRRPAGAVRENVARMSRIAWHAVLSMTGAKGKEGKMYHLPRMACNWDSSKNEAAREGQAGRRATARL